MNKRIVKGVASAVIVVLVFCAFFSADNALRFSGNAGLAHAWDYIINDCEDVDVVFMGTSHCAYAINTRTINRYLGTKSVLAAWAFQFMGHTYWAAKELIEKKKPDILVLEVYSMLNLGDYPSKELASSRPEGVLRSYSIMSFSMNRLHMAFDEFGNVDEALIAGFPALSSHNIWKKDNGLNEALEEAGNPSKEMTGLSTVSYMSDETAKAYIDPANITAMKVPIGDRSYKYIEKLIALCETNGVKLVLYAAPVVDEAEAYFDYDTEMQKLAELEKASENVFFLDYSADKERLGITQYHYMEENIRELGNNHLNYLGSDVISRQMARDLYRISPGTFPAVSSEEYLRQSIQNDKENTFDTWMKAAGDDTVLLMASAGPLESCMTGGVIPTAQTAFLKYAGIKSGRINKQHYVGIYANGKNCLQVCSDTPITTTYLKKGSRLGAFVLRETIRLRSYVSAARIKIGDKVIDNRKGGVLMVLYDARQGKIVKTAIFDPMNSDVQVPAE